MRQGPGEENRDLEVLRMAQERGMVICPTNSQKPSMICCCCGCSCMVLENLKKYENPAQYINSNYYDFDFIWINVYIFIYGFNINI